MIEIWDGESVQWARRGRYGEAVGVEPGEGGLWACESVLGERYGVWLRATGVATRFGDVEGAVAWAAGAAEKIGAELFEGFTGVATKVVAAGRIAAEGVVEDTAKAPGEEVSVVGVEVKKMGIGA